MKVLIAIFLTSVIVFTLFGKLKVQKKENNNLFHRFLASLLVGLIMDLVLGLPILGLLSLFGL
jgi:quinol-cytochrome oxidoreductase complex cytochrome b subunit